MDIGQTEISSIKSKNTDRIPSVEEDALSKLCKDHHVGELRHDQLLTYCQYTDHLSERSYNAESDLRHPLKLLRAMFHDLWISRELAWRLFVRDLNAQYRQSILGYLWVILPALGTMLIWVFLNSNGILEISATPIPYPVFVITGLVLWDAFVTALNAPQTSINSAIGLLTKINFPREALLVSAAGQVVFGITVRLLILLGVYGWFGVIPQATAWLAPLGLLGLVVLGFAMGLLLLPAVMLYQDFSRGLAILTGPWFFLTPVVYPSPTTYPGTLINWLNPVSPLLTGTRNLITVGTISNPTAFIAVSICGVFLLFGAWVYFRLAMPHLIARMNS